MKNKILLFSLLFSASIASAQNYQVPVSEQDEPMMTGKFEPTWQSLENYQVPEWFRNVKFGIWRTGDHNASKAPVTGWRAASIWKAPTSIITT